ncbi:MAG: hypothetical protein ACREYF_01575 [Gammaproteobacteria bacterium]
MTNSVQDARDRFNRFYAEEQESFEKYLRTYRSNEKIRNKKYRGYNRGCLSSSWYRESLVDKSILVIGENRIGDEILTIGCLEELGSYCRHVVWRCDATLKQLFHRAFPGADFVSANDPIPEVDGAIYSWELIKHFRPALDKFHWTISGEFVPYLRTTLARETPAARYGTGSVPLVGLAWRSESVVKDKTCDLKSEPGWSIFFDELRDRVHFVSLQRGDSRDDRDFARSNYEVEIHQDQCIDRWNDLDDVATQVAALDYIVSISTTVIHLAGALGVPGWVLLPHKSFAHWQAGKHVSLWYPTVCPVRQENAGEWGNQLQRVANELSTKIG